MFLSILLSSTGLVAGLLLITCGLVWLSLASVNLRTAGSFQARNKQQSAQLAKNLGFLGIFVGLAFVALGLTLSIKTVLTIW